MVTFLEKFTLTKDLNTTVRILKPYVLTWSVFRTDVPLDLTKDDSSLLVMCELFTHSVMSMTFLKPFL